MKGLLYYILLLAGTPAIYPVVAVDICAGHPDRVTFCSDDHTIAYCENGKWNLVAVCASFSDGTTGVCRTSPDGPACVKP
ncbi:hypothetical protein F4775DRAFT_531040 [Biscogniauxia sp. FL1348]|nr:hypothetical protein F4775DRAFT_531040 [Biscogniauxia sp. FL1348]